MELTHVRAGARHDLSLILQAISVSTKIINTAVQRAGIQGLYGLEGVVNIQGEDQKKLDVLANTVMVNALTSSQRVAVMVSEENPEPIFVSPEKLGDAEEGAKYTAVFDPLDG